MICDSKAYKKTNPDAGYPSCKLGIKTDGSHLAGRTARGLLHDFSRREMIPCTLAGLCTAELEQWDSHRIKQRYECNK
ncbi:hypothetical protein TELCIR_05009, partial [Teladorsagia circumcincta]